MTKTFKIVSALLIMLILLTTAIWHQYDRFMTTPLIVNEEGYVYTVKAGSNLQKISRELYATGLSSLPPNYLYFYGRLKSKAHLIKAGEYLIKPGTTLPQCLDLLISGKVIQYPLTIVEGMTAQQLINMLVADTRLKNELTDTSLKQVMITLGHPDKHGEGEFSPETYYFTAGTTDKEILRRAHLMMSEILEEKWKNRADNLPYKTPYEALIMASIIEKESGIAEERPQIAGVFVRRLQKRMRLQTDPTVIYGLGSKFDGNIRRKDLTTDTPYNTYTRYGLPPTPIALPSKESIDAALHPAPGSSLYFVATGHEGRHIFSDTLTAHNKAVRKYQLKK